MPGARRADVAFLWLGETLLIPHLWPIVDALAHRRPDLAIDLWISTSVHEDLVRGWLTPAHAGVAVRRAPGFQNHADAQPGENVRLPWKPLLLARLVPYLSRVKVVVCAERTTLWLPRLLPLSTRFIFTMHGGGPINIDRSGRLKSVWRLLVPGVSHKAICVAAGADPDRIVVTGYMKTSFANTIARKRMERSTLFPVERPIVLYTPHWQRHRSSWWAWGADLINMLKAQTAFNVILAPHQRLFEIDTGAAAALSACAEPGHVHVDADSFAMVDGSYTAMADIYLGDTSSQLVEFMARPRPCVLLHPPGMNWQHEDASAYGSCGQVVTRLSEVAQALREAPAKHAAYADFQSTYVQAALGDTSADAPLRAADVIIDALA